MVSAEVEPVVGVVTVPAAVLVDPVVLEVGLGGELYR
jgi:hypothetical protein